MPDDSKTDYLGKYGERVARNGWTLVLLRHGDKKPMTRIKNGKVQGWIEIAPDQASMVPKLVATETRYGFGIKCGNVIGLDDDYEEGGPVTKDFLKAVSELKEHYFPEVLLRRGRATRPPLQVFRLEGNDVYKSTDAGKLQIIAKGRQFVAYNMHPDTKRPYAWMKEGVGSPYSLKVREIPSYPKEKLDEFINAVLLLEDTWGVSPERGTDVLRRIKNGEMPSGEIKGERSAVENAVKFLINEAEWGWEEWNGRLMMPLFGASGGEDWGLALAHEVSAQHDLYDPEATDKRWEAMKRSPPTRIGAGTIFWQARQNGMPFQGPRDWDHYRAFLDRTEVLNTQTSGWMERSSFNDFFSQQKEKGFTPIQSFMTSRPNCCYDSVVWDPSLPYGEASKGAQRVWNTCIMPTVPDDDGDIGPWLALVHNVYGPHADIVIQRLAFDVQYPARKPQWHVLTIGDHGVGKNLNLTPLRLWFGEMAMSLNAARLEEQFTSFMVRKKHLEVVELAALGNKTFNRHKDLFATADPWYEVNEKFRRPYLVKNVASVHLSTNEVDPVSLSPTERRIYVVRKRDKPLSKTELLRLHNRWIPENWRKVIGYLAREVDVPNGFGDLYPGATDDFKELVSTAGRAHDKIRQQVREATRGCPLFGLAELHQHFVEAGVTERPGFIVTIETVRKTLIAEGAIRVHNGAPIRLDGEQRRLWSFEPGAAKLTIEDVRGLWLVCDSFKQIVKD